MKGTIDDYLNEEDEFDWGRMRAPWLGRAAEASLGQTDLERMVYFGWVWERQDAADSRILNACKNDDAELDLSLWAVGGDEANMERARDGLRAFLLRVRKRATCR